MMLATDVFVIGGGPAGLAAAIAARSRGLRVMVADGNRPPIDKACGEGLMPDAISAAGRIGIVLPVSEGFHFRGIRFHGEGHSVAADFPSGFGVGCRRTLLHGHLVEQAARAGVEMLWSTPVTGIEQSAVLAEGRRIETRWIIGADAVSYTHLDVYKRQHRSRPFPRAGARDRWPAAVWRCAIAGRDRLR